VPVDVVIVDGDNVAHARWRGRRGRSDVPRMRAELVEAVVGYAARIGVEAHVVFDGAGVDSVLAGTSIVYSGEASGDSVVERLAYAAAAEGRGVTVVSADRELRMAVAPGRVHVLGPREFLRRAEREAAGGGEEDARQRYRLGDALDAETRAALERMRRGGPSA
jgi:predicted RNA-binding protein with PIN domain